MDHLDQLLKALCQARPGPGDDAVLDHVHMTILDRRQLGKPRALRDVAGLAHGTGVGDVDVRILLEQHLGAEGGEAGARGGAEVGAAGQRDHVVDERFAAGGHERLAVDLEEGRRAGGGRDLGLHVVLGLLHGVGDLLGLLGGAGELPQVGDVGHHAVVGRGVDDVDLHAELLELAAQLVLDTAGGQHKVRLERGDLLHVGVGEVADLGQALGFFWVVVVAGAGDHLVAGADGVGDLGVGRSKAHDAGGRLVHGDRGACAVGDRDRTG